MRSRSNKQKQLLAAIILFAIGFLIPTFIFIHHQYNKWVCQRQLTSIFNGIKLYSFNFDGKLPAGMTSVSQTWYKVGHQGKENHSNTHNLFLLLKLWLRKLSTTASMNHNRQGQNVLFSDGQVEFLKTRHIGILQDDIFTVQNIVEYRGNE